MYVLEWSMNNVGMDYSVQPSAFITVTGCLITYFMEQSPSWEANRFSASQEIPHILWNSKVH